jgi:hypothetical protein
VDATVEEPPELLLDELLLDELLLDELPDLAETLPELLLDELPDLAETLPELLLDELPDLAETPPELLLDELPDLAEALPELLLEELPELLEEPLAGLLLAGVTWIEKAGNPVVVVPSLAVMTMLPYRPVSGVVGVPESSPLVSPKVAQTGLFWMPKLTGLPLGFATVG